MKFSFWSSLTMGVAVAGLACSAALADGHKESSPAEDALKKLMDGNARFVAGEMMHPNLTADRRAELAQGQSPYAIIVSCSDSRVPPEQVFDAGPGDLFVIRVAGNVVGDDAQASIEYAVAVLNSPLVVVMGHESCGAVDAAVTLTLEGARLRELAQKRRAYDAARANDDPEDDAEHSVPRYFTRREELRRPPETVRAAAAKVRELFGAETPEGDPGDWLFTGSRRDWVMDGLLPARY
ncbi:MAG: carbonic anhydrase, partial [Planctomycetota bacterium]